MKVLKAVIIKELAHLFNSPTTYIFAAVFLALNNFFYFNNLFLLNQASLRPYFANFPLSLIFFVSLLTMGSIAAERKSGTLEILLSLPITKGKIIWAKFMAVLAFFVFTLFFSLLNLAILLYLGRPDIGPVLSTYLAALLLVAVYAAVGIFISTQAKDQLTSLLLTVFSLFVAYLMGENFVLERIPPLFQEVGNFISPTSHFLNFLNGLIYPKDIIYFFSLTAFFLYLSIKNLSFARIGLIRPWQIKSSQDSLKLSKLFLLVVLLLALNFLSIISLPFKLDLTQNHIFTLSPATKKVMAKLDDIVTIKVFTSSNLPPRFLLLRQNLRDVLEVYRWLAKGKIRLEWLAPDKDEEAADLAQRLGIPQLQFSSIQQDKFQVSQGYFGLAILFEDRKEIIPILEDNSNLEYLFTSSLKKIASKEKPTVGLVSGHGEIWGKTTQNYLNESLIEKVLGKEFLTEGLTLDGKTTASIPENFKTLIIAGPKEEYDEKSRFALDQFIMKGQPVLFFLDGVAVNENLQAQPAKHNLFGLLEKYGLNLKTNLVLDSSAAIANFNSGLTTFFVPYPYWVKVLPEGINQNNPATFGLQGLVLPWVSTIDFPQDDERYSPLIRSSEHSWLVEKDYNLNPTQNWKATEEKARILAVLLTGQLQSAFATKDVPVEFKDKFIDKTEAAKILLVGDSEIVNEELAAGFQPNLHFLLNILEFLTASENLAQIQVKAQDIRPLKIISPQQTEMIKYGSIVGLPLFVCLIGLSYLYWRTKSQFSL